MRSIVLLATALLMLGACTPGRGPARPGGSEGHSLERHLAALEQQITALERQLGSGRGAYRDGSLLRVEGRSGGSEPPLDRLRRLERELADAEGRLTARDQRIADLTRELGVAREHGRNLSEQAGDLSYAHDALITAQQALAEAKATAEGLRGQLAASELQRLRAEREQYRFAAALLRLAPGQTGQLLELQDEVRESARSLDIRPTGGGQ